MSGDILTVGELDALAVEELIREGKITNLNATSRTNMIVRIFNRRIGKLYSDLKFNMSMGCLTSASGVFLDLIGASRGVTRRKTTAAVVDREDEIIKFYVTSGTLKAKLPAGQIPAGTTIQDSTGTVSFSVTEAAPFDDVTDFVYVSAASQSAGSSSNVGTGVLQVHSLGVGDVLVTNAKNIDSGSDDESDDNYRWRIANGRAVSETGNLRAVRTSMLPVPGVADVVLREYAGYIDALVLPARNYVQDSVVKACQFLADRSKAGGIRVVCRGPSMVTFEIYVQIQMTKATPSDQSELVKNSVRTAILNYFARIPLAGTMVLRQLQADIQGSDPRIYDHRVVCMNFNRKPQLLRNYTLRTDEMFTPDQQSENPVSVVVL